MIGLNLVAAHEFSSARLINPESKNPGAQEFRELHPKERCDLKNKKARHCRAS
jgi:hypothetical protein